MELVEQPIEWTQQRHAAGTKSYDQHCTWGAPCSHKAIWSVHVKDKGGDSWWAACEEHRVVSPVLNAMLPEH
ncbi:hypothetical protein ACFYPT_18070 [Streptomyces sp. NPDC005529]|uniref:hypothetical protein n=1 Tax=unclassified Streptomyces TaxID=2593676 RepID=UPI0033B2E707